MSDITTTEIEERNQEYLKGLQGNIGKYLSFLSTMARFHKYEVADLTSFALEAPAMFTAVASKELWAKHFRRKISQTAKGVTLIKDGKKTVYYDVSETESVDPKPIPVNLWQYNDTDHKKFINAIVVGESKTERQLKIIAEELANRSSIDDKSKKLLALSIESVILERMGLTTENATRQLARLSFKDHDILKILEETQSSARIFLDAMQRTLKQQSMEDVTIPENNPLLKEFGVIQATEKIEQTAELESTSKEEPMQLGLFDSYTANNDNVNADETLTASTENASEENTSTTTESADSEPVEEISVPKTVSKVIDDTPIDTAADEQGNLTFEVEENIESADTSGVDETLTTSTENVSEENTSTTTELADSEPVEEIPVPDTASEVVDDTPIGTATDEQNNSDYDFEEMDEEEEILPSTIEKQNEVEILPQEDSQAENISSEPNPEPISEQNQTPEEDSNSETPTEDVTPDLQTILAEDMAVIRGNSVEKNIFRKNIIAIRTLQQIEREKRPATPEELQALKEYAGFGGIPKAFDKNDPKWNREAWLLQSMLTDKEYNAARASTLNAHYTSSNIVQGIYNGLENLGFNGGTILEASMGLGGFFGNMQNHIVRFIFIDNNFFDFDCTCRIFRFECLKIFIANNLNHFLLRSNIISVSSDRRQHFMEDPTLKFFCFRFTAHENQPIHAGFADEIHKLCATALSRMTVGNADGHFFIIVKPTYSITRILNIKNAAQVDSGKPRFIFSFNVFVYDINETNLPEFFVLKGFNLRNVTYFIVHKTFPQNLT